MNILAWDTGEDLLPSEVRLGGLSEGTHLVFAEAEGHDPTFGLFDLGGGTNLEMVVRLFQDPVRNGADGAPSLGEFEVDMNAQTGGTTHSRVHPWLAAADVDGKGSIAWSWNES